MGLTLPQLTLSNNASSPLINLAGLPIASSLTNVLTYDSASGQLSYTSSAAVGGGGGGGDITDVQEGDGITVTNSGGPQPTVALNTGSAHFTTGVGKLAGGSDTQIQFKSGSSDFSGSSNFTFNYTSNIARLTGSLNVSGSATLTGSLSMRGTTTITSGSLIVSGNLINDSNVDIAGVYIQDNINASYQPRIANISNGTGAGTAFIVDGGSGISGSRLYINPLNKGNTVNPYYSGSVALVVVPSSAADGVYGDASRPMKFISSIAATSAASSFEWHYSSIFTLGASTLRMKLDVPSGILSNSGSIVTSGSLTIASGSANTKNDTSLYFGNSGSNGSWRFSLTNGTMSLQAHNGSSYVTKQEWT